ncbi:MAG TPA: serine hydrolase domain-containing protein [Rhizomicrobium sp.]|nr:serine hydrolase domain-containing protein [Rhizomicrobium sp.]
MRKMLVPAFLLLVSSAAAQPAIPDTAMGKTLSDYLAAINSGDAAQIDAFKAAHHFGVPLENLQRFSRDTGGFTLLKVESSDAASIVGLAQEKKSDAIARFTIQEIGTAEAPKLSIGLRAIERPAEYAIPRLSQADALKALEDRAREAEKSDKFSGSYLIARDGKILAAKAFGWEDREAKRKATLDTKFRIGSMNKMFTAVATLQLVAAKKLSLDGTVGTYLPDYPNKEIAQKVTVRMLLTHTGGTGDFFGPEYDAKRLSLKTHADYMALFGGRAPRFAPGSRDAYSNYGFLLLGNIIEKVSGQSYYDYVAKNIFAPAGMTNTGSAPEDEAVPHRATAYTWKDGWISAADTLPYRGTSAGGGYSTAGDLLKFAQALKTEKLLPGRLVADATTAHNHSGYYGYGFSVLGKGPLLHVGHNGGAPGQNGDLQIYPALGIVIVALSNVDPPAATSLSDYYANRMPATR